MYIAVTCIPVGQITLQSMSILKRSILNPLPKIVSLLLCKSLLYSEIIYCIQYPFLYKQIDMLSSKIPGVAYTYIHMHTNLPLYLDRSMLVASSGESETCHHAIVKHCYCICSYNTSHIRVVLRSE